MNDLLIQFVVTYTDGCQSVLPLNAATELCDRYVRASFSHKEVGAAQELEVTLEAIEHKEIALIDLKVLLPDAIFSDDTQVFLSGYTTNDVAACHVLKDVAWSNTRDIILYKNSANEQLFGAGFSTVDRFFTYIRLEHRWLILRHSMEDKKLNLHEKYRLEKMFLMFPESTDAFFDLYTDLLCASYPIGRLDVPTGWCSWSCYYSRVNQKNIQTANEELSHYFYQQKTNTVQIDDGWQSKGSFSGFWEPDQEKFPAPLSELSNQISREGRTFGLWLAPLLASQSSGFFEAHPEMQHTYHKENEPEHSYMWGEVPTYTLDIGKQHTMEHLRQVFERCNKEYGAQYFKLDFLMFSLHRLSDREQFIVYQEDYATAIYRRMMMLIRRTVGDSFMLACGAPISESVGIFNGIRITPDIIWGKSKQAPTAWELIKMCTNSIACRYFYNGKVFVNDPDGLVVRDFDYEDGFDVTYQEARTWATSVAMSGGSSLINEQMGAIGPMRREFFAQILPPLGVAARPVDFFELPQPSKLYIKNPDGSVIVALYNLTDKVADLELELADVGITGEAICMRTWSKDVVGVCKDKLVLRDIIGHSAEVLVLTPIQKEPVFAFAACNIYGGAGIYSWNYKQGKLSITTDQKLSCCSNNQYYIYLPNGYELPEGTVTATYAKGKLVQLQAVSGMTEIFECHKKGNS